jgi:uncharacterized protein YhfF
MTRAWVSWLVVSPPSVSTTLEIGPARPHRLAAPITSAEPCARVTPPLPCRAHATVAPVTDRQLAFWQAFVDAGGVDGPHEAWSFGDTPEQATALGLLVRDGAKRATASLLRWYAPGGGDEALPAAGELGIILDGAGEPLCVVRTTAVEIRRFGDVDAAFARAEGEGDGSLAHWQAEHRRFFAAEGIDVDDDTELVLEHFDLLWSPHGTPSGAR